MVISLDRSDLVLWFTHQESFETSRSFHCFYGCSICIWSKTSNTTKRSLGFSRSQGLHMQQSWSSRNLASISWTTSLDGVKVLELQMICHFLRWSIGRSMVCMSNQNALMLNATTDFQQMQDAFHLLALDTDAALTHVLKEIQSTKKSKKGSHLLSTGQRNLNKPSAIVTRCEQH